DVVTRVGAGLPIGEVDYEKLDSSNEEHARELAQAGAKLAGEAGLKAEARIRVRQGSIADTVLAEAGGGDAEAIVLGTRGLTGLKSLFWGSVSHAVVQRADRPVIVVPSAELAADRAAHSR